jgi:hypothetical protein
MASCRRCGGEVVKKSRRRLAVVGALMLAALGFAVLWPPWWASGVVLGSWRKAGKAWQ